MDINEMRNIVAMVKFFDYEFTVTEDARGSVYLQAIYPEPDTVTGRIEHQYTRRWLLSPLMCKSEIVQTVFKCCMTSMEHKAREWFRYKGRPVFGPHFDVDALYQLCGDPEGFAHREVNDDAASTDSLFPESSQGAAG